MTISRADAAKKAVLENRLKLTLEQYARVSGELTLTTDADKKVVLEEKIKELEREAKTLESELKSTEIEDPVKRDQHFTKHFPEIDYQPAMAAVRDILQGFESTEGGAALFLIQRSQRTGGEWCVDGICNLLRDKFGDFERRTVEFLATNCRDQAALLRRLGSHFGLKTSEGVLEVEELAKRSEEILMRIADSVDHNDVVFIELRDCHLLEPCAHVLQWFVDEFWSKLTGEWLDKIREDVFDVKIIIVLQAGTTLKGKVVPSSFFCSAEQFEAEKIVDLKLGDRWLAEDIFKWLKRHSKWIRPPGEKRMSKSELQVLANLVFEESEGEPRLVHHNLRRRL